MTLHRIASMTGTAGEQISERRAAKLHAAANDPAMEQHVRIANAELRRLDLDVRTVTIAKLDAAFDRFHVLPHKRMAIKTQLGRLGVIE
jgi:hypothetical protein